MKRIVILSFLFLTCYLEAYETIVESDEARYNGELITLTGNVSVQNAMGKVTAKLAILKKDEERITKIDFPWIELQQNVCLTLPGGGILHCDTVYFDYTQMTSSFFGTPELIYTDTLGEIHANKARIDYQEIEGKLEATKVTLYENVRLVNLGNAEKPASQYALADEVYFYPQEQLTILEGKKSRVLFYDQLRDMQLSARSVRAQKDPITKNESVQGLGDVRFIFGPEELDKIKANISKGYPE